MAFLRMTVNYQTATGRKSKSSNCCTSMWKRAEKLTKPGNGGSGIAITMNFISRWKTVAANRLLRHSPTSADNWDGRNDSSSHRDLARARKQLYEAALWWSEHRSTAQAILWLEGFEAAISGLANHVERHSLIPDNLSLPEEFRQMTYGIGTRKSHRAVFEIRNDRVYVCEIRHLAQDTLTAEDLT